MWPPKESQTTGCKPLLRAWTCGEHSTTVLWLLCFWNKKGEQGNMGRSKRSSHLSVICAWHGPGGKTVNWEHLCWTEACYQLHHCVLGNVLCWGVQVVEVCVKYWFHLVNPFFPQPFFVNHSIWVQITVGDSCLKQNREFPILVINLKLYVLELHIVDVFGNWEKEIRSH